MVAFRGFARARSTWSNAASKPSRPRIVARHFDEVSDFAAGAAGADGAVVALLLSTAGAFDSD
jgi:hypothetical protein